MNCKNPLKFVFYVIGFLVMTSMMWTDDLISNSVEPLNKSTALMMESELFFMPDTIRVCYANCERGTAPIRFKTSGVKDTIVFALSEPTLFEASVLSQLLDFGVTTFNFSTTLGAFPYFTITPEVPTSFSVNAGDRFGFLRISNITGTIGQGEYLYFYENIGFDAANPILEITDSIYVEISDYNFEVNIADNSFFGDYATSNNSFSEAINCANAIPGPNEIRFAIPGNGPFNIVLNGQDTLSDPGTTITAVGQGGLQPAIRLRSNIASNAITIDADDCSIFGLGFTGIIGDGIRIEEGVNNTLIGGGGIQANYFVGCDDYGINALGEGSLTINGNTFGTMTSSGIFNNSNDMAAISIRSNASVTGNRILGEANGIEIKNGVGNNTIFDNSFGEAGQSQNLRNGMLIRNSGNNTIQSNSFYNCSQSTIFIEDSNGMGEANGNRIQQNTMSCSEGQSIVLIGGANTEKTPPEIVMATTAEISGTGQPNDQIEVFANFQDACFAGVCEGFNFIGTATCNASGEWSLSSPWPNHNPVEGEEVTTTSRDVSNNTCAFANCVLVDNCAVPPAFELVASIESPCVGEAVVLSTAPLFEAYNWDDNSAAQELSVTESGFYQVTVTDANQCTNTSEIEVSFIITPLTQDDVFTIINPSNSLIDVIQNDNVDELEDWFITIVESPNNGTATISSDNEIEYTKINNLANSDQLVYELCINACPQSCSRGILSIDFGDPDKPKTILLTPSNQDGKNDVALVLENLEDYPNNKIVVFNEWGDLVYEKRSYNNDWDGTGRNGKELPQGTYYFQLSFFDNIIPDVFGLIVLLK